MSSNPSAPKVSLPLSFRSPAVALDSQSPQACPGAPPPSPRLMSAPEDVVDGVFRDLPLPPGLTATFAAGLRSFGNPEDVLLDHASALTMAQGNKYSPEVSTVVAPLPMIANVSSGLC